MPTYKVVLRHVNNHDNVVELEEDALTAKYAEDAARRRYLLPANWETVSVEEVGDGMHGGSDGGVR